MTTPFGPTDPALRGRVGRWLAVWAVMVLLTVVVGGVTRLTESGLSITEWRPVSGVMPPLSEAQWMEEFAKYQQIPEYQEINRGMSLGDFQRIYLVEYFHRLWARVVGLAFAIPLAVFLVRRGGGMGRRLSRRLILLLVLLGIQGAMGWYMVQSGLTERTDVSQYRLAAHLGLALVIFGMTLWTAADLLRERPATAAGPARRWAVWFTGLVGLTVLAGAFVAGLDAGRAYNTFPLMGGRLVPLGYLQRSPWWVNLFEHIPAVQFNHRVLGTLTALASVLLWSRLRKASDLSSRTRSLAGWVGVAGLAQAGLGIATLLLFVPVSVAAVHQAGAVVLLGLALLLIHSLSPRR